MGGGSLRWMGGAALLLRWGYGGEGPCVLRRITWIVSRWACDGCRRDGGSGGTLRGAARLWSSEWVAREPGSECALRE